jgi:hypothetical protein
VVVTQHPPGRDHVFLNACQVSLSRQYHKVQHIYHRLKRNKKENKIKLNVGNLSKKILMRSLDIENKTENLQNNIQHLKIKKYYIK